MTSVGACVVGKGVSGSGDPGRAKSILKATNAEKKGRNISEEGG